MMINKIKSSLIEYLIMPFGILSLLKKETNKNFILMYHGIDSSGEFKFNYRHTSKKHFESQLNWLKKNYNIITVEDFFEEKFLKGKPNIAITFDDGYLNNYTNAFPLLIKYNVPATIYCTGIYNTDEKILWADFVNIVSHLTNKRVKVEDEYFINRNNVYYSEISGKSIYEIIKNIKPEYDYKLKVYKAFCFVDFKKENKYNEYWQLMNDEQIKEISESKIVKIGSHGFLHNNLGNISIENAESELKMSVDYLENITNTKINSIAYPDGSYNHLVKNAAERNGLKYQLATDFYLYPELENNDRRIKTRRGIYSTGLALEQIYQIIK